MWFSASCTYFNSLVPLREFVTLQVVTDLEFVEVIEPGLYEVFAGGSQPADTSAPANVLHGSFVIEGETVPLSQC